MSANISQDNFSGIAGTNFAGTVAANAPIAASAPVPSGSPKGTATAVVEAVDFGCSIWSWKLDESERSDLSRDLEAVLIKHGVPDIPASQEIALAGTVARIVVPRIMARKIAKKELEEKGLQNDSGKPGKERVGQERVNQKTGFQAVDLSGSPLDLIS